MPSYIWDFSFLLGYQSLLLTGIWYTLLYTAICVVLGMLIGVLTALPRLSNNPWICGPFRAYVEIFRCTPVLVQLVWFYYALPVLTGVQISAMTAAVLCLSLYGGAFYSEIFRGGIVSVDEGQSEAAKALGMRRGQVMWRVILPQALKRMVPPLVNQSIMQLKNTSLLSVLALPDLLYQGQVIAHDSYRPLEVYSIIALAYFVILLPATMLSKRLERRMSRNVGA
ncbi:amino acid ABC transporter permease [Pseudomonas asiatica]|uniref:amino acid ABC transporter permease n=1 Tax=Pseudomonas asiatica TaxID=2219225 RepID=UPI0037CBFE55